MTRQQATLLSKGRLHLHDGPIDLILSADGREEMVRAAYAAAVRRFSTILDELCSELPLLRQPMSVHAPIPRLSVARRMDGAVRPLSRDRFMTRMAAVAGSVADEILAAMTANAALIRAYVNNGGDIALHLSPDARFTVGLVSGSVDCASDRPPPAFLGTVRLSCADGVFGVATSGFGGRSFSFGIADAVTVLASEAALADALATLVANAVDLPGHASVERVPARDLDPNNDLGERLVTRKVGFLRLDEIAAALDAGAAEAERLSRQGRLAAAAISLRGRVKLVGSLHPAQEKVSYAA